MPKEKTIKTYQYAELSDTAKERARDWFLEGDFDWHIQVYEDAEQVGLKITAFDIDRGNMIKGGFKNDARHTIEAVLGNHGETCETYKTASRYKKELDALAWTQEKEDSPEGWDEDAYNEKAEEFLSAILEDYLVLLRHEYEYRMSEEYVAEMMEANEYEFDENGRRV